eukprot:203484-Prorocentrum_minimum.AAC.1
MEHHPPLSCLTITITRSTRPPSRPPLGHLAHLRVDPGAVLVGGGGEGGSSSEDGVGSDGRGGPPGEEQHGAVHRQ